MAYSCLWRWIPFHKQLELIPTKRSTLASPIHPFEKQMNCMFAKYRYPFRVKGYSIILDVPCQFDTKTFPYLLEFVLVSYFSTPIIHSLKFRSYTFSDCFYLRYYPPRFAAAKVESKSQKIESALLIAFTCLKP